MAEADDQDKPPAQEWVLLGDLIKRKALELGSLESAETWVRRQLHEGRLPFRYRDARGGLHSGKDLPGGFCLEASINPGEHSARCREKVVPTNPVLAEYVVRFTKPIWPQALPEPEKPPAREYTIPAIEIFCVEVLVPRQERPAKRSKAAPAVEPASPPQEPRTKEDRALSILVELGTAGRLRPGMQPREVQKLVRPIYRDRWPADCPPDKEPVSKRVTGRAYTRWLNRLVAPSAK